eukprot:COSAG01_NODE_230_length_21075_cov_13.811603_7_plen_223_part_00
MQATRHGALIDVGPLAAAAQVIGSDWLQPGTDLRSWESKDGLTGDKLVVPSLASRPPCAARHFPLTSCVHWRAAVAELVCCCCCCCVAQSEFDFLVLQRPGYDVPDLSVFGPRLSWLKFDNNFEIVGARNCPPSSQSATFGRDVPAQRRFWSRSQLSDATHPAVSPQNPTDNRPAQLTIAPESNASSTEVRKRAKHAWAANDAHLRSMEGLVPPAVLAYALR